jgi:hypothetical protein
MVTLETRDRAARVGPPMRHWMVKLPVGVGVLALPVEASRMRSTTPWRARYTTCLVRFTSSEDADSQRRGRGITGWARAYQVRGPTIPSRTSPLTLWKAATPWKVCEPNTPSMGPTS